MKGILAALVTLGALEEVVPSPKKKVLMVELQVQTVPVQMRVAKRKNWKNWKKWLAMVMTLGLALALAQAQAVRKHLIVMLIRTPQTSMWSLGIVIQTKGTWR